MKRIAFAAMSLSAALLLAAGCGRKIGPGTARVARTEVKGVEVATIVPRPEAEYMEASGTVKARTVSVLASKVMGAVRSVNVREGQRVRSGEVLLTIDDSDLIAKVRQAEAARSGARKGLEAAKANLDMTALTYERYRKLYEGKAISGQEFDQVKTRRKAAEAGYGQAEEGVRQAEAGLREAEAYLGYTKIKAPFSGIVTAKMIDAGSMASPGMPLLKVEDTSGFLLEVNASERYSSRLHPGMTVDVAVDTIPGALKGRITEVVPAIDPQTRTFLVKIALNGRGLKTGLFARARAAVGKRTVLAAPMASVVSKGGLTGVYTVDDKGVITYRLVRLGDVFGNDVEILSGLGPEDRVIIRGAESAVDGGVVAGNGGDR